MVVSVLLAMLGVFAGIQVYRSTQIKKDATADAPGSAQRSNEKEAGDAAKNGTLKSPSNEEKVNPCSLQSPLCTMIYAPATCSLTLTNTKFEHSGSSACAAKSGLYRQLCSAGNSLTPAENSAISCRSDE